MYGMHNHLSDKNVRVKIPIYKNKLILIDIMDLCLCIQLLMHQLVFLTRKAIFFSLFIAENCLRRERTAGSSALSGATPFSHIQG